MQTRFNNKFFYSDDDKIDIMYMSKFLSDDEANRYFKLFEKELVYDSAEDSSVTIFGKKHKIPRKQVAYGDPGSFYTFSGVTVKAKDWFSNSSPVCLAIKQIKNRVELITKQKFNFVLINRYADGNDCIGFHSDDEVELGNNPTIVGVSLGAEREIHFKPKNFVPKELPDPLKVTLKAGSIFIMTDPTNKYWKHSIPKRAQIKKCRISLTFRNMVLS